MSLCLIKTPGRMRENVDHNLPDKWTSDSLVYKMMRFSDLETPLFEKLPRQHN